MRLLRGDGGQVDSLKDLCQERAHAPIGDRFVSLHRGESGQTTVLTALFMATFLFGFVALGIDVQALFHARRSAQAAADAAAIAAAEEASNGSTAELAAAKAIAKMNGFDTTLATNPATVTLNSPPTTGGYINSTAGSYFEAIVSKPFPTFLIGVVNHKTTMTISARSVAGAGLGSPTCICLEGTSGMDLNLSNDAQLSATGCGTTVNSTSSNAVGIVGSAGLNVKQLGMASTTWVQSNQVNNGGSIATGTHMIQSAGIACSPPLPAAPAYTPASCTADPLTHYGNGGSSYSVGPGSTYSTTQSGGLVCYNSLTVGSNGDAVNLNAGIYVINGGSLHFLSGANNASNTGGNGVFFYLIGNASLTIDNGANVNLTAPSSGTYAGILVFEAAADTQAISIQGGSNISFNGAIYAPSAVMNLANGSGTSIDAAVLASQLNMAGGGTLNSTSTTNFGTLDTSVAKTTE